MQIEERRKALGQEGASCNDSQQSELYMCRFVQGLTDTASAVEHVWFVPSHYLCEPTLNAQLVEVLPTQQQI